MITPDEEKIHTLTVLEAEWPFYLNKARTHLFCGDWEAFAAYRPLVKINVRQAIQLFGLDCVWDTREESYALIARYQKKKKHKKKTRVVLAKAGPAKAKPAEPTPKGLIYKYYY